ncbi:HDOD domain-containing protein [Janthinobacterium fluminis]|uniref:HDOD domain-containing protein n=1 Tax=Janthinobacterium fluminis TaxID=2987524 RepID=A0ABT5JTR9_9BURK|nr:HDOD domain-containing protein [Janthinobacterium fluminis]MDC8756142.1 HDOD domain-containing protein [Janthinobacterium fluminis]
MFRWLQRLFLPPAEAGPPAAAPATPPPPAGSEIRPPEAAAGISFEQKDRVNTLYHNWLFDSRDDADLDVTPQESQVLDALETIMQSKQSGADLVRRMPGLIPQVLQSLRTEHFSGADIARKISSDIVLVAAVIRLANNAIEQGGSRITSIEHAIIVIGQEGLRQLVTSVAFRPIIDLNSGHFTRLLAPRIWDQSERCAIAGRIFAGQQDIDPFQAFLAGLVQNVGLIVSLRMMDQVANDRLGSPLFCASLLRNARLLSCSIGQEWHFPEPVTLAIREQLNMHKRAAMSPLGQLLSMSDYLSKIKILAEQARLDDADAGLFAGLPAHARACYDALDAPEAAGADGGAP